MIHLRQPTRDEMIEEALRRHRGRLWGYDRDGYWNCDPNTLFDPTEFFALIRAEFRKIAQGAI